LNAQGFTPPPPNINNFSKRFDRSKRREEPPAISDSPRDPAGAKPAFLTTSRTLKIKHASCLRFARNARSPSFDNYASEKKDPKGFSTR
jgi:hypothetical protein